MACMKTRLGIALFTLACGVSLAAPLSSASEFYRFKRVNGEWIEGQFKYRSRPARRERSALREPARRSIRRPTRTVRQEERPLPAPSTTARADATAATSAATLVSIDFSARDPEAARDLSQLKAALEKRAAERAAQIAEDRAAGVPLVARAADPVSVSLDFRSGLKTTRFANGEVSAEAFDETSLRTLAASPPLSIFRD